MIQRERLLINLGILLFIGGLVPGLGGTVVAMFRAFNEIQTTGQSSSKLAEDVAQSMLTTDLLIPVIVLGLLLMAAGWLLKYFGKPKKPEEVAGMQ